jgi:gamma-glutamylcyclotransferase
MSERVFAYGSNMCIGRFLAYGVHPEQPGQAARMDGYSLRFNKRSTDGSGKANVERQAGQSVWGVLYLIPDAELPVLAEGEGGYTAIREVTMCHGESVPAWLYIARRPSGDADLRPYSWYKRFLVEGARSHGLPQDYISTLEAIVATEDPNRNRDREKRALTCDGAR